jgi:phosphohistidine swiveling domain-containing protein
MKNNRIKSNTNWFILEEIPPLINPNAVVAYMHIPAVNDYFKKQGLKNLIKASLSEFSKSSVKLCFLEQNFEDLETEIFNKIIADPDWGLKITKDAILNSKKYFAVSKKVYRSNLQNLTNKQINDLYLEHFDSELKMRHPGWIFNTLEMKRQVFSKYLLDYIDKKIIDCKLSKSPGDIFSILTTPLLESYAQREHTDLLRICFLAENNKKIYSLFTNKETAYIEQELLKYKKTNNALNKHVIRYGWLSYQYTGPGWKKDYFISVMSSILRQKIDVKKHIREHEEKNDNLKKDQANLINELNIDSKHKKLFKVAQGIVFSKGIRKDSMFYGYYCQDFIHKEIARRKYLSIDQVRNIYFWELKNILDMKKNVSSNLTARLKYHIYLSNKDRQLVYTDKKANEFIKSQLIKKEKINKNINELIGTCASPGRVRGVVYIVNNPKDMQNFNKGNILVSVATNPDLMPAMRKSNAIVTDVGGMTCHAAIVSRELGKPCIVGTKIATKILKNGTIVEVDATHGRLTIIK